MQNARIRLRIASAVVMALVAAAHADSTINSTERYAYSANAGWIDARPDDTSGAGIGRYYCSNYLYGANIGWISLGSGAPANGWRYSNLSAADYGVNHDGLGNLSGYAYGANIGWIAFETDGAPRVDTQSGKLSGYAYSANIGWIGLSNAFAQARTDRLDAGPDSDSDGLPDAWEMETLGNLTVLAGSADSDGDGMTDADEYIADTSPILMADFFEITSLALDGGTNVSITWTSEPRRMYRLQSSADLADSGGWSDEGPSQILPDLQSGSTSYTLQEPSTTRHFRVRAILPLSP